MSIIQKLVKKKKAVPNYLKQKHCKQSVKIFIKKKKEMLKIRPWYLPLTDGLDFGKKKRSDHKE